MRHFFATSFPIVCCLIAASCATLDAPRVAHATPQTCPPDAVRGVWVPTPNHTDFLTSRENIERHLAELASANFNAVYVVMWNQGRTFFPSRVMKNLTGVEIDERMVGRDPLQEVIAAAKPHNIKVYAWFEFGFATDWDNGKGREILERKPAWAAIKQDGSPLVRNKIRWMDAFNPEVQEFMLALLMEVVERYNVAGIQGDDRLPAFPSEGGYNPGTVARYRAEHQGRVPPVNHKDPAWVQWRADQLNVYMARIHRETKARKPAMAVSMAPSVWPWVREEFLQDWPPWLKADLVDHVTPQLYRKDVAAYRGLIEALVRDQVEAHKRHRVFPGVLLRLSDGYRVPPQLIREMVAVNRAAGLCGEVYFFNEGVRDNLSLFRELYVPAFSAQTQPDKTTGKP
jgi:uncharacterized lipoprotein YddW (UPF0748 family)